MSKILLSEQDPSECDTPSRSTGNFVTKLDPYRELDDSSKKFRSDWFNDAPPHRGSVHPALGDAPRQVVGRRARIAIRLLTDLKGGVPHA